MLKCYLQHFMGGQGPTLEYPDPVPFTTSSTNTHGGIGLKKRATFAKSYPKIPDKGIMKTEQASSRTETAAAPTCTDNPTQGTEVSTD